MTTTNTDKHLVLVTLQSDPPSSEAPGNDDCRITTQEMSDPVFMHLSRSLTVRELVQLKTVSKRIMSLVSLNSTITALARWEDDRMDWYFPVLLYSPSSYDDGQENDREEMDDQEYDGEEMDGQENDGEEMDGEEIDRAESDEGENEDKENDGGERNIKRESCKWAGIHRPSGEYHRLPSLTQLLHDNVEFESDNVEFLIRGGRGGLLLFLLDPSRIPSQDEVFNFDSPPEKQNWHNLVVGNPVTKQCRTLPVPDCRNLSLTCWEYCNFQSHLVVDKKVNAYKVILIHRESLCIYNSTTNCWSYHILAEPIPFGIRYTNGEGEPPYRQMIEDVETSSTVVNGRLHFAELEYKDSTQPRSEVGLDFLTRSQVRVYEVDDEAGTVKPGVQYELRKYIPSNLHRNVHDYGFRIGSYKIGIVECMGGIYAIIPAKLNIDQEINAEFRRCYNLGSTHLRYADYGLLQLRFYILRLEGSIGRRFGQLLMQETEELRNLRASNFRLEEEFGGPEEQYEEYLEIDHPHETGAWYQCTARGSVIWVALPTYVLQYDVVSGQSAIDILQGPASTDHYLIRDNMAFEPSLYIKS